MRRYLAILFVLSSVSFASTDVAVALRNQAMNALPGFNPSQIISNNTETPAESTLKPNDSSGSQVLHETAQSRLTQDDTARFVVKEEHQRAKITPNDKSSEIVEGARYIDSAEEIVRPGCHKEPVPCEEHVIEKTCEEKRGFKPVTCTRKLNVRVHALNHPDLSRIMFKKLSTIDLTKCTKQDVYCTNKQLVSLHSQCEYLKVSISFKNREIPIIKAPTCGDPTITIDDSNLEPLFKATIKVSEYWTDDAWDGDQCQAAGDGACFNETSNTCMDANQTKVIEGVPVTRRCWGEERKYQCVGDIESNCETLLDAGCSNTQAKCLSKIGDYCVLTSKVFQCTERICFPDREVCPPEAIPCANGSCDNSKTEESDDINEGISRLGTLAGTATEVATNQVQSRQPSIFKGESQECEKYILNIRDCCTDDGFLDGLIHCPAEMQVLQRAKVEHRAVYLGHYKHHLLGTTRYVYCVFPSKLSGIVQIQGRYNQLQIPFGEAEKPNCRGITPEELERINFKALDLHELVDELVGKKALPEAGGISNANEAHIDKLNEKGVPYDK